MICATCGQVGTVEQHHPGGRANLAVTVPLCRECHAWQTGSQHQAGAFRPGSDWQRLWSIFHGFTALLIAHAHAAGDDRLAADGERQQRAMLRLLAAISDQPLGPSPGARSNVIPPRAIGPEDAEQTIETLTGLFPAIASMIGELLPGDTELLPGLAAGDVAELLSAIGGAAADADPDAGSLLAAGRDATALMVELAEQLAAATIDAPGSLSESQLHELALKARGHARRCVELLLALVTDARETK